MTVDEIVGIDDSPSARAGLRWAAAYARSTGAALPAIQVVDWPEAQDKCVYPVVADYVYPDVSGWSVGHANDQTSDDGYTVVALE
jgi:nucleotide-binding universal stress UspA family protein